MVSQAAPPCHRRCSASAEELPPRQSQAEEAHPAQHLGISAWPHWQGRVSPRSSHLRGCRVLAPVPQIYRKEQQEVWEDALEFFPESLTPPRPGHVKTAPSSL